MEPKIRQLPVVEPRVESGPVVFGEDWPGLFIRGDHAANFALHLRMMLESKVETWVTKPVLSQAAAYIEILEQRNTPTPELGSNHEQVDCPDPENFLICNADPTSGDSHGD